MTCKFCEGQDLVRDLGITSSFFASRGLNGAVKVIEIIECRECLARYFNYNPPEGALERLYSDYRSDAYYRQRNKYEPWYTRRFHNSLSTNKTIPNRLKVFDRLMEEGVLPKRFNRVLDHGGDRGFLVAKLPAKEKYVFDISGVETEPGVLSVDKAGLKSKPWDFILSTHVLEHLPSPIDYLQELDDISPEGSYLYLEVPDERFKTTLPLSLKLKSMLLKFYSSHSKLFLLVDFISVISRRIFKILPTFGFVALREHFNFLTKESLSSLVSRTHFQVVYCDYVETGHLVLVGKKANSGK